MLQVRFGLLDHIRNSLQPMAKIWNPVLRGIEIAGYQKIKTVGETLIVNEWVPLCVPQLLKPENFVIDIVAQNPDIDLVWASKLFVVIECFQRLAHLLRIRQHAR